ncbi:MAG: DUF2911 domain-containing protein [Bryobacteraceae bacterium]|jgi:hypothetical protein
MTQSTLISATLLTCAALSFAGNPQSPSAATSVTIGGKTISIKYSAPSLRGRQMFSPDGRISKDPNYPVWRAGADEATALHTDADLTIAGLNVPKGDYTVFVLVNVKPWQLIINKQTKQWGLEYHADQDLGRVPMTISKPAAPIETLKISLLHKAGNGGDLKMEWENVIATVPFTVK